MYSHLPVLIVGAGPTGLMMACELERHDIPFRIIDKKSEPTQGSNATWIQTRTLEIFDAIGMIDRFLQIGHQCEAINFYENGKALVKLPLKQLDSPYPFILMLPQKETERLLTARLEESKIRVERSLELIDIKQSGDGVVSTVQRPDGSSETITSHWVVACDGANSTIREKCQIQFPGGDIAEQFMVADAKMSSFLPTNEIHVFFDKGTIFPEKATLFSAFPWGSQEYRLSANLYSSHPRQFFTEQEVKEVVAERTYGNYIVEKVSWISPFWIHSKVVNRMQNRSIFLAGDAAHIHSPAGGQGMNSGIQDAYNLAWKLAFVVQGKAKPSLLESYQSERHPVVNNIVKKTESLTKMALFDKTFLNELRKFSKNISNDKMAKQAAMEVTQLDIRYQHSPIIDYREKASPGSPQQGERAPDVVMQDLKTLYHYLQSTLYTILIFSGDRLTESDLLKIKQLKKDIDADFMEVAKTIIVAKINFTDTDHVLSDETGKIHEQYQAKQLTVYIIRPDSYIAYYANEADFLSIKQFLLKLF